MLIQHEINKVGHITVFYKLISPLSINSFDIVNARSWIHHGKIVLLKAGLEGGVWGGGSEMRKP